MPYRAERWLLHEPHTSPRARSFQRLPETHQRHDVSAALLDLADSLAALDDLKGAQREQTKAVRLRRKFFKRNHLFTLEAEAALAGTLRERGLLDESAKMLSRIVVVAEGKLGRKHAKTLGWSFGLSKTLQKQGRKWQEMAGF
jgi:hypothetical protein